MNIINKLERKFGKYAIHNLMYYIIILYIAGVIINFANPNIYHLVLRLDFSKIFRGEVWRFVTFLIQSPSNSNLFFLAIEIYVYYMLGTVLEKNWGAFRFNLYMLTGVICNILATFVLYVITKESYNLGLLYLNRSLFFAFAMIFPNMQFLFMFIIPIKVKYLAYFYAGFFIYEVIMGIYRGDIGTVLAIILALANFLIFFFGTRNYRRISPNEIKRKATYKKQVKVRSLNRHKCSECGKTEKDDENLEFRYCSKCNGNYEYCQFHLFTHKHITK